MAFSVITLARPASGRKGTGPRVRATCNTRPREARDPAEEGSREASGRQQALSSWPQGGHCQEEEASTVDPVRIRRLVSRVFQTRLCRSTGAHRPPVFKQWLECACHQVPNRRSHAPVVGVRSQIPLGWCREGAHRPWGLAMFAFLVGLGPSCVNLRKHLTNPFT